MQYPWHTPRIALPRAKNDNEAGMNLPNLLTLIRIVLIPVFVLFFYLPVGWSHIATAAIFALAGATDWLDGWIARRYNLATPLGAFLDPVADKLMVAVALVLLVEQHHSLWLTLPASVIVSREIVISALREWMAELGKRTKIAVSWIGKVKTSAQMLAILLLLANPLERKGLGLALGYICLYIAVGLTLWSMIEYLRAAWPELRNGDKPQ